MVRSFSLCEARIALAFLLPELTTPIVAVVNRESGTSYAVLKDGSVVNLLTGNYYPILVAVLEKFREEPSFA